MPRPPASNRGCPDPVSQVMNQHRTLTQTLNRYNVADMMKLAKRMSLFAAASLLFANLACTCAVAGTHPASHQASQEAPEHAHHVSAEVQHDHGTSASGQHAHDCGDTSCHQAQSGCAECGGGISAALKNQENLSTPASPASDGELIDHALAYALTALPSKRVSAAFVPAWSSAIPPPASPVTRNDQLTE